MVATVNASTSAGVVITPDNSGVLAFQSSSATALTIDASQNSTFVGTASATKLIPTGSSATGNGLYLPAANSLGFSTNGAERMRIDSSGNVGINTASPSTYVNGYNNSLVVGDGTNWATIQGRTDGPSGAGNGVSYGGSYGTFPINGARIFLGATSAGQRGIITFNTKDLDDSTTQPLERMRISSGGVVMVATTNLQPAGSGDTKGISLWTDGTTTTQIFVTGNNDTAGVFNRAGSDGALVRFRRQGSDVGSISVTASATAYNTSSDYRLKENIAPMTGALAKVVQLKPVTYKWKINGADGQGFIAHELAEVVPDCVTGAKDATEVVDIKDEEGNIISQETKPVYQGVDTSFLVATLTAAIQELKAINDTLTARIVALENR
jgi:hypothetical protein